MNVQDYSAKRIQLAQGGAADAAAKLPSARKDMEDKKAAFYAASEAVTALELAAQNTGGDVTKEQQLAEFRKEGAVRIYGKQTRGAHDYPNNGWNSNLNTTQLSQLDGYAEAEWLKWMRQLRQPPNLTEADLVMDSPINPPKPTKPLFPGNPISSQPFPWGGEPWKG